MTGSNEGKRVCVIGLGNMGSALAEALLAGGHRVTVWNRTAAKCEALAKAGASVAASVSEAAAAAQAIVVCVTDHEAGESLLRMDAVAGALRGKLLVQLSTMTADQSQATALWAEARGAVYLEGSILGLPLDVTGGSAIVVYAGPREVFEKYKPVFSALGGNPKYVSEDIGAAVTFDKIVYACGYGVMHAYIQGAALAHAKGVSVEAYTDVVTARMPSYARNIQLFGDNIAARNHDDVQCRMDVHAAAFSETLALCMETGVDDGLPATMMRNFERAIAEGHGARELSALFEVLIPDRKAAPEG